MLPSIDFFCGTGVEKKSNPIETDPCCWQKLVAIKVDAGKTLIKVSSLFSPSLSDLPFTQSVSVL